RHLRHSGRPTEPEAPGSSEAGASRSGARAPGTSSVSTCRCTARCVASSDRALEPSSWPFAPRRHHPHRQGEAIARIHHPGPCPPGGALVPESAFQELHEIEVPDELPVFPLKDLVVVPMAVAPVMV